MAFKCVLSGFHADLGRAKNYDIDNLRIFKDPVLIGCVQITGVMIFLFWLTLASNLHANELNRDSCSVVLEAASRSNWLTNQSIHERLIESKARSFFDSQVADLSFRSIANSSSAATPDHPLFRVDRGRWHYEAMLDLIAPIRREFFSSRPLKDQDLIESLARWLVVFAGAREIFPELNEKELSALPLFQRRPPSTDKIDPTSRKLIDLEGQFRRPKREIFKELIALSALLRERPQLLAASPEAVQNYMRGLGKFDSSIEPEQKTDQRWDWLTSKDPHLVEFTKLILETLQVVKLADAIGTRGNQTTHPTKNFSGSRLLYSPTTDAHTSDVILIYLEESQSLEKYVVRLNPSEFPDLAAQVLIQNAHFNKGSVEINIVRTEGLTIEQFEKVYTALLAQISNIVSSFDQLSQVSNKGSVILSSSDALILHRLISDLTANRLGANQEVKVLVRFSDQSNFEVDRYHAAPSLTVDEDRLQDWASDIAVYGGLKPLASKEVASAFESARLIELKENEILVKEGESSDFVYFILEGEFEVTYQGKSIHDYKRRSGLIGDMGVASRARRNATVRGKGKLIALPAEKFRQTWLLQSMSPKEAFEAIRARFGVQKDHNTWAFPNTLWFADSLARKQLGASAAEARIDEETRNILADWSEQMRAVIRARNQDKTGDALEAFKQNQIASNQMFKDQMNAYRRRVDAQRAVVDHSASVGKLQNHQRRIYRYPLNADKTISIAETYKDGKVFDREMIVVGKNGELEFLKQDYQGQLDEGDETRTCQACHLNISGRLVTFGGNRPEFNVQRIRVENRNFGGHDILSIPLIQPMPPLHQP